MNLAAITHNPHDPMFLLGVALLIVFFCPLIFSRFNLPVIIGLILAGVAAGPHGAGIFSDGPFFDLFRGVGIAYIMFIVGVETEFDNFLKHGKGSLVFGALTFIIPLTAGVFVGYNFMGLGLAGSVLLGAVFSVNTLLSYPVVSRMGLSKNRAVVTTVGGTLVTNTLAMILLAAVAELAVEGGGGIGVIFWSLLILKILGFCAAIFLLLPWIGHLVFRNFMLASEMEFAFILGSCFFSAWLAKCAGIEPVVGAFAAGLAVGKLVPDQSALLGQLKFVGNALFIPLFLLSVGLLVDFESSSAGAAAVWSAVWIMLAVGVATKWLAAFAAAKILKFDRDEAWLMFGMSVIHAAVCLAILMVGTKLSLFPGSSILNGGVALILGTAFIGPWLTEFYGKRVALKAQSADAARRDRQRVMVSLSNPETVDSLMGLAFMIRDKGSAEPIHPVTVVTQDSEESIADGEALIAKAVKRAKSAAVPVASSLRIDLSAIQGLSMAMREKRASVAILGWSGVSTTWRAFFNTFLDNLLSQSSSTVIACRIASPLEVSKRLVVFLPPLVERHAGLPEAIRTVATLAGRLSAKILLVGETDTVDDAAKRIEKEFKGAQVERVGLVTWRDADSFFKIDVLDNDLLILFGARKGSPIWQPNMDRLPYHIASNALANNFLAIYLAEPRTAEDSDPSLEFDAASRVIDRSSVFLGLETMDAKAAVKKMIYEKVDDIEMSKTLTGEILNSMEYYPVELVPGAVLLHSHTDGIASRLVLLGVNRDGFEVPGVKTPVKLLLILLNPKGKSQAEYLKTLSMLAKALKNPGIVEAITASTTPEEASKHF